MTRLLLRSTILAMVLNVFAVAPAMAGEAENLAGEAIMKIVQVTEASTRLVHRQTVFGTHRLAAADENGAPDALLVHLARDSAQNVTRVSHRSAHIVHAIGTHAIMMLQEAGADPILIAQVQAVHNHAIERIRGNAQRARSAIAEALEAAISDGGALSATAPVR